jgi:hypothetical protein
VRHFQIQKLANLQMTNVFRYDVETNSYCTLTNYRTYYLEWSRSSSGSIVSDYGLDDRAMEVRSPREADFSSSPCVQTGSGAHPASYPMGTLGSFPGGRARPGRDLTTHPHLVPRLRMSRSYTSCPPMCLHGV